MQSGFECELGHPATPLDHESLPDVLERMWRWPEAGGSRDVARVLQAGYAPATWQTNRGHTRLVLVVLLATAIAITTVGALTGANWLFAPLFGVLLASLLATRSYARSVLLGTPATEDTAALLAGPGVAFVGTIGRCSIGTEPVFGESVAAYTVLLHDTTGVRCYEARCDGFSLSLDDGTEIIVPAGSIRLQARPSLGRTANAGERVAYLEERGHLLDKAGDLGRGQAEVWVLPLGPGDRIELLAHTEMAPSVGHQPYRGTASIQRVAGMPLVTLLERRHSDPSRRLEGQTTAQLRNAPAAAD